MATKKRVNRSDIEWVGGIVSLPGYVTGEGEPYRPELLLWITADGLIVGMDTARPGELIGQIVAHFQQTSRHPMVGPAHVPTRIRVASEEVAGALRAGLGEGITVVCAEAPEIEAIVEAMSAQLSAEEGESAQTYLAPGLDEEAMAAFFRAAAGLFAARPWAIAPDDESLLLVTCEALGLREAVVCFMGHLGESFGLVLFRDLDGYEAFLEASLALDRGEEPDLPPHFAINFERGADLNPALETEVRERGWTLAGEEAYPWLTAVDGDMLGRPPTPSELSMAEVLALALPQVLREKEALLRAWLGEGAFSRTVTVDAHAGSFELTFRAMGEAELAEYERAAIAASSAAASATDETKPRAGSTARKQGR
jgi:hypothetical protein